MNMRTSVTAAGVAFTLLTVSGCVATHDHEPPVAYVDDKVIISTITARYAESADLALSCITVESLYGVVLLSGMASGSPGLMAAQQIAGQVDGVQSVHHEILIQAENFDRDARPGCRASLDL